MLKNFLWQREDQPQNMLAYLFLAVNLFYGITFTFFTSSTAVQASAFAAAALPSVAFGVATLSLFVLTMVTIATRNRFLGEIMGFWGVVVWSYGAFLYMAVGLWFPAQVIYVPQILFWTFWYIGVKRFYAREDRK